MHPRRAIGTGTLRPGCGIAAYFAFIDLHFVLRQIPTSSTVAKERHAGVPERQSLWNATLN